MKPIKVITYFILSVITFGFQSCGNENEPKLLVEFSLSDNNDEWSGAATPFVPEKNTAELPEIFNDLAVDNFINNLNNLD